MAQHSISKQFQEVASLLLTDIADYYYNQGLDGYEKALAFKDTLYQNIEKVSMAPLRYSSDWGNPQRRCFFLFKLSQYTLILIYSPPNAKTNRDVSKVIFTNLYPSVSSQGNGDIEKNHLNIEDLLI